MVTEAMDAFGQTPWPEAQRGVFAFRHDWAEPLIERLQWATGVARLASGNEARQGLRRVPRRFLTYHVGHAHASDALVADWLADHLDRLAWWPLPQHAARLTSAAPRGALALAVTPVDAAGFTHASARPCLQDDGLHWPADQRFALLMAPDGWQALALTEVEPDRLWLTQPLVRAVPAGATILPLVEGLAVESAEFAQWVPGVNAGSVTAQVAFEPPPDDGRLDDPGSTACPSGPMATGATTPPIRRMARSRGRIFRAPTRGCAVTTRGRRAPSSAATSPRGARTSPAGARLARAQGRLGACWLPDGLAPVLRVQDEAEVEAGYLRVDAEAGAAFWHRPVAALILHPDGQRQHVLTGAFHRDDAGVLVLRSGLDAPVPVGSRVVRLARCRLDHDTVDLYWHTPDLVEIPLTLRRLPEPRGNDRQTYEGE